MGSPLSVLVVSDVHFASPGECERRNHESYAIRNPLLRFAVRMYRHHVWLRDPLAHNDLIERVLEIPDEPDLVVANGDYSVDSAFIGVSDPAACQSARICLEKLRRRFGDRFLAVMGDHELGKMSLFGGRGGLRIASLRSATAELGLQRFWKVAYGANILMGVTSSLVALPVYEPETLPDEREAWREARETHMEDIRAAFTSLEPGQRVILFCHDPTALPCLWQEPAVRGKLTQVSTTFIGHLHSELILWKSRLLAGMPSIRFLGNSVRRMSQALHEAKRWKPFKVRLCPALAGIELLKDGGYLRLQLPSAPEQPISIRKVPVPRSSSA